MDLKSHQWVHHFCGVGVIGSSDCIGAVREGRESRISQIEMTEELRGGAKQFRFSWFLFFLPNDVH